MHKHADLREALRTRRVKFAGREVKAHSKKGTMSAMQFTLTAYFVLMASMFGLAEAACDVRDAYYAY